MWVAGALSDVVAARAPGRMRDCPSRAASPSPQEPAVQNVASLKPVMPSENVHALLKLPAWPPSSVKASSPATVSAVSVPHGKAGIAESTGGLPAPVAGSTLLPSPPARAGEAAAAANGPAAGAAAAGEAG